MISVMQNKILFVSCYHSLGDSMTISGMIDFISLYYDKIIIFSHWKHEYILKFLYKNNIKIQLMDSFYFFEQYIHVDSNEIIDYLYLLPIETWNKNFDNDGLIYGSELIKKIKPRMVFSQLNPIGNEFGFRNYNLCDKFSWNPLEWSYYKRENIPIEIRYLNFPFIRCYDLEEQLFEKIMKDHNICNNDNYAVICEYDSFLINKKYIKSDKVINLHNISKNFFDIVKIIENANEIHLIENSVSLFLYLLQASFKIKKQTVNLHIYSRKEQVRNYGKKNLYGYIEMYLNPELNNWNFIFD